MTRHEDMKEAVVLGIDVEEWFQTMSYRSYYSMTEWRALPTMSEDGLSWLLERLAATGSRATFFVNGWLAEHRPGLVESLVSARQEIACHGFEHDSLINLESAAAVADLERATEILRSLGVDPVGFRAPNWSLRASDTSFLEALHRLGYMYDASVFPLRTPWFGEGITTIVPTKTHQNIVRIFPSCPRIAYVTVPLGMGMLLRLLPRRAIHRLVRVAQRQVGFAQLNSHSWELAGQRPPAAPNMTARILTGIGIQRVRAHLDDVLISSRTISFRDLLSGSKDQRLASDTRRSDDSS